MSVDGGRFKIDFEQEGIKDIGINLSIVNGLIKVDGLELSEEQIGLLKNEGKIRSAVSYGEKAFAPYSEYLD